jgi:hypothetical protein
VADDVPIDLLAERDPDAVALFCPNRTVMRAEPAAGSGRVGVRGARRDAGLDGDDRPGRKIRRSALRAERISGSA